MGIFDFTGGAHGSEHDPLHQAAEMLEYQEHFREQEREHHENEQRAFEEAQAHREAQLQAMFDSTTGSGELPPPGLQPENFGASENPVAASSEWRDSHEASHASSSPPITEAEYKQILDDARRVEETVPVHERITPEPVAELLTSPSAESAKALPLKTEHAPAGEPAKPAVHSEHNAQHAAASPAAQAHGGEVHAPSNNTGLIVAAKESAPHAEHAAKPKNTALSINVIDATKGAAAHPEGAFRTFMQNEKWMGKKGLAFAAATVAVGAAVYAASKWLEKTPEEKTWVQRTSQGASRGMSRA